ncbi:MAG: hypothetical protein AAGI38_22630 [Bacteroidota bacterium]
MKEKTKNCNLLPVTYRDIMNKKVFLLLLVCAFWQLPSATAQSVPSASAHTSQPTHQVHQEKNANTHRSNRGFKEMFFKSKCRRVRGLC